MADQIILNRQQLSAFFTNPEAIKAFEQLFTHVAQIQTQTAPEIYDDILAIIANIKTPTSQLSTIANRIELIEQQQRKINSANSDILNRLKNLESLIGV